MKDIKNIIIIILALLLLFVGYDFLTREDKYIEVPVEIEVPVPSVEGTSDTVYVPYPKYVNNPLDKQLLKDNDSLLKKYQEADSIIKELQYKDAISIREYKEVYEDTFQTIEISTKTRGHLLEQSLVYKTKPYKIKVDTTVTTKVKGTFKASGLIEMGTPILSDDNFSSFVIKPGILLQNSKNFGLSVSIDTEGKGWLGVYIPF